MMNAKEARNLAEQQNAGINYLVFQEVNEAISRAVDAGLFAVTLGYYKHNHADIAKKYLENMDYDVSKVTLVTTGYNEQEYRITVNW